LFIFIKYLSDLNLLLNLGFEVRSTQITSTVIQLFEANHSLMN